MREQRSATPSSSSSSPPSARALVRMARLLTAGDDAAAEDLVQTTLTRLYVHWPRVRRAGNPVGYARTSLTHAFVDEQRRAYTAPRDARPTRSATGPATTTTRTSPTPCSPPSPRWRRASARSWCSATSSTSTSPRPPGSSAAPPAPSSPRTPRRSGTSAPSSNPPSPSRRPHVVQQGALMNDLNALLDRAAGPATVPVDARADLTRGHRALSRTRRRRGAGGLRRRCRRRRRGRRRGPAGTAGPGPASRACAIETRPAPSGTGISFLAQPFEAGPYTFDQTPEGWEVQGAYPQGVTIAPVGFPDQEPLVLRRQAGHHVRRQPASRASRSSGTVGPSGSAATRATPRSPRRHGLASPQETC